VSIHRLSKYTASDIPDTPVIGTATDVGTNIPYGNGAVVVTFSRAATGGAPSSYTATSAPGSLTATGSASPLTVQGLTGNTFYTFTATGTTSSGTSGISASTPAVLATTVPSAPTFGSIDSDDGRDHDDGAVNVTFSSDSGGKPVLYYTVTSTPSGISKQLLSPAKFNQLPGGTAASFSITATNANGTSAATSYSTPVTPKTRPAAPVLDSVTAGTNRVTVAFHGVFDTGSTTLSGGSAITSYIITYGSPTANTGDTEHDDKTISITTTSSPYIILNLKTGYTYRVSVQAVNQYGVSLSSNVISRTI
jgi:Fibronectin type III domain